MNRFTTQTCALSYFFLFLGAWGAFGQARPAPPQYYWGCGALISDLRGLSFQAAAKPFPVEPGLTLDDGRYGAAASTRVSLAWDRYLLYKYLPEEAKKRDQQGAFSRGQVSEGPGACKMGSLAQAQAIYDSSMRGTGARNEDWVYSPDQTAAATAAAPPPPQALVQGAPVCPSTSTTAQYRLNVAVGPD